MSEPSDKPTPERPSGPRDRRELTSAYDQVVASFGSGRPVTPGGRVTTGGPSAEAGRGSGKRDLLHAYDDVVEHEATRPEREAPPEDRPSRFRRYAAPSVGIVCLLASIAIWVFKPTDLFPRFEAPSSFLTDAQAKNAMLGAALFVGDFYDHEGRLPRSAKEAGIEDPGVTIQPLGSGRYLVRVQGPTREFVLEGQAGGGE